MSYEEKVNEDLFQWRKKVLKRSTILNRASKRVQMKINEKIPEKAHQMITESIKKIVQATLVGSEYTTKTKSIFTLPLQEKERLVNDKLNIFKRTAAVEGAGTGAGGIFLGLADFPLLLSIKMKFLFETAAAYGFDTREYEERIFILYVFQLAFSSDKHRKETFDVIENWEQEKFRLREMDWKVFQQEYRDYIDLVKMLQMIPGIGAIIGAYANYNLLDHLGETAINCYRLRLISGNKEG